MRKSYAVWDVFTEAPLQGNPLAIVDAADDLSDERMQAIAREFNLSETVFILPPANPAHTARIRIFTSASELPFAGHPTVGAAIHLAEERVLRGGAVSSALIVLEALGGLLRVGVTKKPGEAAYAEFDAPKLPEEAGQAAPDDRLAAALGLAPSEIGFENHRPTRFAAGPAFTFVPVSGLNAIRRARVVHAHWSEGFGPSAQAAAYVYCRETVQHKCAFHVRMFAPGMGMPEDPATGSAAIALAAVIQRFDEPGEGEHRCIIEQGAEMLRPSDIHLEFHIESRRLRLVRIGGRARQVMRGELFL
ncbi:MAG: PhzF family phenazine biosynthesis protein [Hyphomicrobiales bacterium]|nr:PhzF family phenazine biosynthesis protein [Hyphomicrobiales bacterium]